MILVIDNYDSFTYNLVQYLGELGATLEVYRNDQITLEKMAQKNPEAILISSGPGRPDEAGISMAAIRHFTGRIPILGVGLGHQCIARCFGGQVVQAHRIMHGKTSEMIHDGKTLFQGIASPLTATRYHSLILERESLPSVFRISGETAAGEVMAIRHQKYPLEGIQFDPASILTPEGKKILGNFLKCIPHPSIKTTI
ncbi:aminodeoxychorismate/anthranilate synthase component II [Kroppenstedtia pulmonis]|uniref:Aminodeoxychorismate/anthranilate synthase component II n=1 Tax=Kroppenstedtia pulmonis TaxID=1380685 RepID=A0A7D3Y2V8_9BACL|nr:aminodeoxychorismate/anthranilate synthase component II [Kroppenstedtia pulmonis]QKG83125.1 aminodeoxychorismate/anthranilate synthase component II [Kroppenstedtia pulmonis]